MRLTSRRCISLMNLFISLSVFLSYQFNGSVLKNYVNAEALKNCGLGLVIAPLLVVKSLLYNGTIIYSIFHSEHCTGWIKEK